MKGKEEGRERNKKGTRGEAQQRGRGRTRERESWGEPRREGGGGAYTKRGYRERPTHTKE